MGFISDLFGGGKLEDAAKEQAKGFKAAGDLIQTEGERNINLFRRFPELQDSAINNLLAFNRGDFSRIEQSPEFQFAREQGQRAVDASGSARGLNLSGAQLKALQRFGQGLASQQTGNFLNRNLATAGLGLQGTNALANQRNITTSGRANAITGESDARASGLAAEGGILGGLSGALLNTGLNFLVPGAA